MRVALKSAWMALWLVALMLVSVLAHAAGGDFFDEELAASAARFEAGLAGLADPGAQPAAHWRQVGDRALRANDPRSATVAYAAGVLAARQDGALWLSLARALAATQPTDATERYELPEQAAAAAYLAYRRAGTAPLKAEALALLGGVLAQRQIYRPALDAYRASLDLTDNPAVRQAYEALRQEHGFRILDYSIDSDATSPRLCVQFSEPLARGRIDFTAFVRVDGKEPAAVSPEDRQLCIEGLRHGQRYEVLIRQGLPSAVGEPLLFSAAYAIYVRDRKPSVRFAGRGYVLPRTGQQGLPLVSVNTDLVAVEVFRIGDRGLATAIVEEQLRRQLHGYSLEELAESRGERVYKGEMPVVSRLNEDVTTAFPVDEALPRLQTGVYVTVAAPARPEPEPWETRATQWFIVSDLGLATVSGDDGVHAFVRSLASAEPLPGVELRLVARNNEVLATATSDARGAARFDPGLARGTGGTAPALLSASTGEGDYAFLDLTAAGLDLSDRGVAGRPAPGPLDAFVFTERGVYRPGETVHVTALVRDREAKAVAGLPLTLIISRPDGVEQARIVSAADAAGGHSVSLPLLASVMTGTWRVAAHVDPKGAAIGEATFLVEDFVPDRLALRLESETPTVTPGDSARLRVEGRYLYGAPASGLALEGDVTLVPSTDGPVGFTGYRFGLAEEEVTPLRRSLLDLPQTAADGTAVILADLPPLPDSTRLFRADFTVRLREPGGRTVARTVTVPVRPSGPVIGIRPLFQDGHVAQGGSAAFDVVAVSPEGRRADLKGLRWQLFQVEQRFQWYQDGGVWRYEPITYSRRVADGRIDAAADAPARLEAPVGYGRYRLEIESPAGGPDAPASSVTFTAGWYAAQAADAPDFLEIALDKQRYRAGETARVTLTPRAPGKALVMVVNDGVLAMQAVDVPANGTTVTFEVGADWFPGAYVTATAYRPMDVAAKRMPVRSVGISWLAFDPAPRSLPLSLTAPEKAAPRQPLDVALQVDGLAAGEQAYVVAAAVDVGILNLTGYEPPAPEAWYYGQRRLGVELRDLYGRLIDGMRAERGALRSGGDGGGMTMKGSPPTQAPLALYTGILPIAPDGTARLTFDLPRFNGTVRVMAVAWSPQRLGHAVADVIVRDPVVVTASLPRFLAEGDRATLHLGLHNVEGPEGEYRLAVEAEGPVRIDAAARSIALARDGRGAFTMPLEAIAVGEAAVTATLTGPAGDILEERFIVAVRPAMPAVTRRSVQRLAARSGALTLGADVFAGLVPGTARAAVSVAPAAALDIPGLILALDRYPYGCAEQITSRALPLLYVNDIARQAGLAQDADLAERLAKAVRALLAMQSSSGGFGLWGPMGEDIWLTAYVTDFLARARERGHAVPDAAFASALNRLRNHVANIGDMHNGAATAYALYVLTRAGHANLGDLRYFADAQLDKFDTPLAKAQLAAALAMLGDAARAERTFAAALAAPEPEPNARLDFGSTLRDRAALLTLAAETGVRKAVIPELAGQIEAARSHPVSGSTQENAWLLLAAHALQEQATRLSLAVNGTAHAGTFFQSYEASELSSAPVRIANRGDAPATVTVTISGSPMTPEPPVEQGFTLTRSYYSLEGEPRDPESAAQNERLVVVLRAAEAEAKRTHLVLVDHLPAGFEIENPRLGPGGTVEMPWFSPRGAPEHTEYRDDRFVAAYQLDGERQSVVAVAYVVRAVTPGRFVHPPAMVEDMYRPERFARTGTGTVTISAAR